MIAHKHTSMYITYTLYYVSVSIASNLKLWVMGISSQHKHTKSRNFKYFHVTQIYVCKMLFIENCHLIEMQSRDLSKMLKWMCEKQDETF